ncbi:DUF799 domain-containing protein [Limnohabitans sp. JirII-31]|uniref:DUF799 domain-containing protein n=1 Tax=Limnohabitans sp. JirII-31 TaxID=1977908 RepID=UPI000C1EFDA2|nr:DUF799 domain-containing protein [Limnohabitans sp. JirII-31]PIT75199.1 hypothetical protein B9Z41_12335 [Limnohabitans sp. JirII-31]
MTHHLKLWVLLATVLVFTGCATKQADVDYSAFRQHQPRSILVLPPLNNTADLRATYSVMSSTTLPLAEAGYYVFPVALVDQTFKENGLQNPGEMHQASPKKLNEIFGADSALYITVTNYGATSALAGGSVVVTAEAVLIDTRTSTKLWEGKASASDAEGKQNQNGLVGLLIQGIVNQVANSVSDPGYRIGRITNQRLLNTGTRGLLPGPRALKFEQTQGQ